MASTGSTAVVPVVPTVEQTKAGTRPSARSVAIAASRAAGFIAKSVSTSTAR